MRSDRWKQGVLLVVVALLPLLAVQARPKVITRARLDLNGDGRKDTIAIRLTKGRYYKANDEADSSCPSCACGAPKYKGKFTIDVALSGKRPVRESLNALMGGFEELEFWAAPWRLAFDDYNRDGRPDFNLGQYGSCSGHDYWLFTVNADGHVAQLEVEDGNPHSEIFASDIANSTRIIRHTARGFFTKGYYNAAEPIGFYTSYYVWNPKKRLFMFEKDVYDRDQHQNYFKPHWAKPE